MVRTHACGQARLDIAARGVEVLRGHLDVAELALKLPEWQGSEDSGATLVHGRWFEGARGRARTKTRMEVTIEKKTPKPNTMPLHEGRSARQEPSHVVRVVRLRDMQAGLGYRAGLGWVETGWSAHKPAASGMRQPEAAAGGAESAVGRV